MTAMAGPLTKVLASVARVGSALASALAARAAAVASAVDQSARVCSNASNVGVHCVSYHAVCNSALAGSSTVVTRTIALTMGS